MPPRPLRRTAAVSLRTQQAQISGIFKLPAEILFEIFSYFGDHRHFIRQTCHARALEIPMNREDVERSTIIRKLTMTCWAMRNTLLPVLWKDVEGCVVSSYPRGGHTYGLYDQCVYLLSNPTIAAHVQILSVDLLFKDAPKDLMKKFVDTLVRLPNLRRLELLSVSLKSPVTAGLKRKCAKFPNIREMIVCPKYPAFVKSCPNLESLTFRDGLPQNSKKATDLCDAELKRIVGVDFSLGHYVGSLVQKFPKLQGIVFYGICYWEGKKTLEHLRLAKDLAIIEIEFIDSEGGEIPPHVLEERREAWKRDFIGVLENSPSKNRKFLRWRVIGPRSQRYEATESGELEVFPATSS